MYEYLDSYMVPYSAELDWAVLFHDIVYDNGPEKEARSALKALEYLKDTAGVCLQDVYDLIMNTADHLVTDDPLSLHIIMADLHQLAEGDFTVTKNWSLIMEENMQIHDCSLEESAKGSLKFMDGLQDRIRKNMQTAPEQIDFWLRVMDGILLTKALNRAVIDHQRTACALYGVHQ